MGLQCNIRCTMCYQPDFSARFNMPPELYRERLGEAYASVSTVKLQGGEPTVMKNCKETALLLREHPRTKLGIVTNGVRIDDFWHETLVAQGGNVSISVNAASQKVYDAIVIGGDYRRVIANIERLLAARKGSTPEVGITAVVLKESFSELHGIIELAGRLQVDYVELLVDPVRSFTALPSRSETIAELGRCFDARSRSTVDVRGLEELASHLALPLRFDEPEPAKKAMCAAPFRDVVVDWDGDVRVCCNTWVKLGNLYKTPLANILFGRRVRTFREKMEQGDYLWCSPSCPENAAPTRLAHAHEYAYALGANPRAVVSKVRDRLEKLRLPVVSRGSTSRV